MILYDRLNAPCQVVLVSTNLTFPGFSRLKKVDKWLDVSQLAYFLGNHSNLAWILTTGMPPACKSLGHLIFFKTRPCSMEGAPGWACPWQATMLGLTISDTICKLRHVRPFYRSSFTKKTPENAEFVENQINLAWCLELLIKGHEKIRSISSSFLLGKLGPFQRY